MVLSTDEAIAKLKSDGFVFISKLYPELDTKSIVSIFGKIIAIDDLLAGSRIGNVQLLRPREKSNELMNQYSGMYGLDEFPFHTDLAHWRIPPRYFLLRCIVGFSEVKTKILHFSHLQDYIGNSLLNNAIVCPRKSLPFGMSCALPVIFSFEKNTGIRWDFLFLRPLNKDAKKIHSLINELGNNNQYELSFFLTDPGDTVLIDNWKVLHGRTSVPIAAKGRKIERAYFKLNG